MRFVNWFVLLVVVLGPIVVALASPLQDSREFIYVVGGIAGVVALSLLLVQPLLAMGYLSGVNAARQRRWHANSGTLLVAAIALHIGALYITSPDDIADALLLRSATSFSIYGVIGLTGVALLATLVLARHRIGISYNRWKTLHVVIAIIVVIASVVHTLWIQGAMGLVSKWVLCATVLIATGFAVYRLNKPQAVFSRSRKRGWRI